MADQLSTDQYNTSFSVLMQNNTFHKNPKILITDGDKILNILTDLLVAPKDKERFEQFIRPDNILERMRCKKEVISCIYQDIQDRWYITYIVPAQYHENGDVRTVLIASRDIDKHQKKEIAYQEELKKTAEDAKLANAAKTTFLRRMSHDIRTPINGIRGIAYRACTSDRKSIARAADRTEPDHQCDTL